MASIDILRNSLIDKLLTITDKDYLSALNKLVQINTSDKSLVALTDEQKLMLRLSEDDILQGRVISQEELDKSDLKWLKSL